MNTPLTPDPEPEYLADEPMEQSGGRASPFPIRKLLGFLLKFWWIPVVTLAIGLAVGIAYVFLKEPTYVSKASMWETTKLRLPDGGLFADDAQNFLGTQSELLQSITLREQALAGLRATTNGAAVIPLGDDRLPIPVLIRVSGSAKSSVFGIEASSANQAFTQAYLNALMQAFLEYKKNVRKVVSGDTLASISEQVQRWERDLKIEQEALDNYERTNNMVILQEEGTVLGSYLAKLKTQLSDLQLEGRLLNATAYETNQASATGTNTTADASAVAVAAGSSPSSAASPERRTTSQELELLKMQREKLGRYLRPKHPKMVKLEADIQRAEKLQEIYARQSTDQLFALKQANQLKIENLQASIKEWEVKAVTANNRLAESQRLKANVQRVQSVYDRLLLLVQNVGISRNIDQESLSILEPAALAKRSYTREISGASLSLAGGLAAGLAIVFLMAIRDDRFTSVTELTSSLGGGVVGMLPQVAKNGSTSLPLLELNDPRHIYAESFRSLRSALIFLATDGERPKILLITSALPNEGKSTVAANLARTLALSGSRVLLVDADLRKGHLHRTLNLKSEPGLSELLRQTCDPEKVVQTDGLTNFSFIARGASTGNPGDLFLGSGLERVFARWRQEYDYVVIDSSPLFAADDASCLAPKVDGTLFIVRSHQSSARTVREALDLLAQRQARVLGVVFNGADASARSYYYYKYADYHLSTGST